MKMTVNDVDRDLRLAMKAENKIEADRIFKKMIKKCVGITHEEAIRRTKSNLGYYAGYNSNEVRERVEELFECEHPVFGKIKELGPPTTKEAFDCGFKRITLKELRSLN